MKFPQFLLVATGLLMPLLSPAAAGAASPAATAHGIPFRACVWAGQAIVGIGGGSVEGVDDPVCHRH